MRRCGVRWRSRARPRAARAAPRLRIGEVELRALVPPASTERSSRSLPGTKRPETGSSSSVSCTAHVHAGRGEVELEAPGTFQRTSTVPSSRGCRRDRRADRPADSREQRLVATPAGTRRSASSSVRRRRPRPRPSPSTIDPRPTGSRPATTSRAPPPSKTPGAHRHSPSMTQTSYVLPSGAAPQLSTRTAVPPRRPRAGRPVSSVDVSRFGVGGAPRSRPARRSRAGPCVVEVASVPAPQIPSATRGHRASAAVAASAGTARERRHPRARRPAAARRGPREDPVAQVGTGGRARCRRRDRGRRPRCSERSSSRASSESRAAPRRGLVARVERVERVSGDQLVSLGVHDPSVRLRPGARAAARVRRTSCS